MADLEELRRELEDVRSAYRSASLERAQIKYITGVFVGAILIVLLTAIPAGLVGETHHTILLGLLSFGGGAIGALLSVLERLTRGDLEVQFEAERTTIIISGISRPFVGALSGLALYALIKSGIAPIEIKGADTAQALFFAGIGVLAGFSERFAKDVLGNAAGSLSKKGSKDHK